MRKFLAFIDESGDPHFNEGASSHIEYSGIIIESGTISDIVASLHQIQKNLNLIEFKSSGIRTEKRRIEILERIKDLNFKFLNVTIDKDKVIGEWRQYPKVFYKYTQKILHRELFKLFEGITVTIDKFGTPKYQASFKKYLENEFQLDLFEGEIMIGSAKDDVLIQVADLISGTRRKLNLNEFTNAEKIETLLSNHNLYCVKWPDNYQLMFLDSISNNEDKEFAKITIQHAEHYVRSNSGLPSYKAKVLTVEYLVFNVKFINPTHYIFTGELINWLKDYNLTFSEEEFRSQIIGQLRDEGVIIAGSRKGLKIPTTLSELLDHLNYSSSKYLTSMRRTKRTIETLKALTFGGIDLLAHESFALQKELFSLFD